MNRRGFLKTCGVAGAVALAGSRESSASEGRAAVEGFAVLVDTTRCVGCRTCERACAAAHGLAEPEADDAVMTAERKTTTGQWTVVARRETDAGEVFVKRQCMHCVQPACAAACLTRALKKTEDGPVVWREGKCMGCRFCMISCPFDVPKFDYDRAVPSIHKCQLCEERLAEGGIPACVENCPAEALSFGRRSEMLAEARRRIVQNPEAYVDHVYGEHEVGGTSYLYLSAVPFEQLGFRMDLGETAYPRLTEDFLYGVPIVLTLWPAFLLALSQATKRDDPAEEGA
jgi:Fe-S-cluster-containing dehydrogenase component